MSDGPDNSVQAAQLASNLKAMLPNSRADRNFLEQRIPVVAALQIVGGPGAPKTNKEAEVRMDRLWAELRRIMDTELADEIARDEIVADETTAEACVQAAKHIFRATAREDRWRFANTQDTPGLTTLRAEADRKLRPAEPKGSREAFEDSFEWPILLALARLLLRAESSYRGNATRKPSGLRNYPRMVLVAFAVAVVVTVLVVALADPRGEQVFARNPAGEIGRTSGLSSEIDDLSVAEEFTWIAGSVDKSALRIDQGNEIQESFDVELPSPTVKLPRQNPAGSDWGGYQIAGGDQRAWIVTTAGTVAVLLPSFLGEGTSVARIAKLRANAGPAEYALGYLWIGGLTGELVALDAFTGKVVKRYPLPGSLGTVDVALGLGSTWALDFSGEKVYEVVPIEDPTRAEFRTLSLRRPAHDIAAGYGSLWAVNQDGTLARYDIDTGEPEYVPIPGKAVAVAISVGSAWVAMKDNAVVRINVSDGTVVGQPIKLPEPPVFIDARHDPWVATRNGVFEIVADPAEKPP